MQIDLNTKYTMRLSIESIEEYEKILQEKKKIIPKIAENIISRTTDIGLEDNYKSTEKLPIENNGIVISGGIKTTDEKDTYKEFGTGIVGSQNPHVSEFLAEAGWIYDVNEHGEKGWRYPKGDGTYGWTKGIPSEQKFYEAMKRMEETLPEIAREEFNK